MEQTFTQRRVTSQTTSQTNLSTHQRLCNVLKNQMGTTGIEPMTSTVSR